MRTCHVLESGLWKLERKVDDRVANTEGERLNRRPLPLRCLLPHNRARCPTRDRRAVAIAGRPEMVWTKGAHCLRSITAATSCAPTPPSTRKNPSQRHRVSTSLFTKGNQPNRGNATIFSKGSSTIRDHPQNAKEKMPAARGEGLCIIAAITLQDRPDGDSGVPPHN